MPRTELRVALDPQPGVGGLAGGERVERRVEQDQPLGRAPDQRRRRAARVPQPPHQRPRAAQPGLDPVAQLDAAEHGEPALVVPEARLAEPREQRRLLRLPVRSLDALGHRRRTPPRAAPAPRRLRAPACAASRRTARGSTGTSGRVRVLERHGQAVAARAHEQELVAARVLVAGDRQRQRRQEVPLDRALQRPRAEVRREALRQQELERRVVELDRPLARRAARAGRARPRAPPPGSRASPAATAAGRRRRDRSGSGTRAGTRA